MRTPLNPLSQSNPGLFIDDHTEEPITEPFSEIQGLAGKPVELRTSKYPILRRLGSQPLKILDIAAGHDPLGLYLASLGHDVTVTDVHPHPLNWQASAAGTMGLDSMQVRQLDVLQMSDDKEYDVVIARMLLHFLDRHTAQRATGNIQTATKIGGLASLSVYTSDNPAQELQHPRNLAELYDGAGQITSMFDARQWQLVEEQEGVSSGAVNRSCFGTSLMLLPTIAEVIMKRTGNPAPAGAGYIPDFSDWNDFQNHALDD